MTLDKVKKLIANQLNISEDKITEDSILILVSVGLEVLNTIETQMASRNYSGFLG